MFEIMLYTRVFRSKVFLGLLSEQYLLSNSHHRGKEFWLFGFWRADYFQHYFVVTAREWLKNLIVYLGEKLDILL